MADTDAIFRNYSDEDVAKWFFNVPYSEVCQAEEIIQHFRKKYQAGTGITWGLVLKETHALVGTCGYEEYALDGCGEIGFDLAKEHWGKGLMREILQAVITYGFTVLRLKKISAITYRTNVRAIALLKHLGFQRKRVKGDSDVFYLYSQNWTPKASQNGNPKR